MAVRMYFNKYTRYNSNKWVWQPYIYAYQCSLEEQKEWNDLYLRCRGRRNGKDKVIPDFTLRSISFQLRYALSYMFLLLGAGIL